VIEVDVSLLEAKREGGVEGECCQMRWEGWRIYRLEVILG